MDDVILCDVCGHHVMTVDYCDYCALPLSETRASCGSDKRSASVSNIAELRDKFSELGLFDKEF